MARFLCPNCQKGFKWHKGISGKQVHCTSCGKPMVVPAQGIEPNRSRSASQSGSTSSAKTQRVARPSWEKEERTVTATPASQPANQWWKLVGTSAGTAALVIIFVVAKGVGRSAKYTGGDLAQTVAPAPVEIPENAAQMLQNQIDQAAQQADARTKELMEETQRAADKLKEESVLQPASVPPPLAPPEPPLTMNVPSPKESEATPHNPSPASPPAVANAPHPGYRALAPGETPFELFDAQMVQHGMNERFNHIGLPPDFSLSLRYRIKPIDQVFNIHLHRVAIKINGQTHPIPFEKLTREGLVQGGFRTFGINQGRQGAVEAWVEKTNPDHPAT